MANGKAITEARGMVRTSNEELGDLHAGDVLLEDLREGELERFHGVVAYGRQGEADQRRNRQTGLRNSELTVHDAVNKRVENDEKPDGSGRSTKAGKHGENSA